MSVKYNPYNQKTAEELTKVLEAEFARRSKLFQAFGVNDKLSDMFEKKIIRNVFELLIERAQSVIAAGYDGLGVQDLKDLAFNEYGIEVEENDD